MYKKSFILTYLLSAATILYGQDIPEKRIVVIIPSYNNALSYVQNLTSVLTQEYDHSHIIYIDDASTDNTGNLVAQFIADNQLENKITLIQNTYNRKALANMYRAAQLCNPSDIILELDGDDSLADTQILKKINELFSTTDVWFAYAQYKNVPEEKAKENKISIMGYTKPTPDSLIESREFRTKWFWSGLRMYYAWLFKQVKLEDLILPHSPYNGKFFPTSKDGALAYPMLEMSGYRIKHIPDVWLLRNIDTPLNDYKIARDLQLHCGATLKASPQYHRLEQPVYNNLTSDEQTGADLLIFSHNHSHHELATLLDSCYAMATGINDIYVFYDDSAQHYQSLIKRFPDVIFVQSPENSNITSLLATTLPDMNHYLILTTPQTAFTQPVDVQQCINTLNSTYAYAFYLKPSLGDFGDFQHISILPCEQIVDDIYTWKFGCFQPQSTTIHNFDMSLYRKHDVMRKIIDMQLTSLKDFEQQWKASSVSMRKIGLFFEQGKI